jgi:hypothetical protein
MEFTLTPELREVLQREFITAIKHSGLVLVPNDVAQHSMEFLKQQHDVMKCKYVSPYKIAKYKLLPGVTHLQTVKNMIDDGRIAPDEWFKDEADKIQILTTALKRLRHE